ncbi:MAG: ATP-dependent DNA helicase RecG, partial [Elusimicrobiota bacterium]|nr:ATP-dependent DNA helicase RecG [Elusimicrobiota bacterium]
MSEKLNKNVRYLKGVGPARAKMLERLEIRTVKDLLTYYPLRYEDRRNLKELAVINDGDTALARVEVTGSENIRLRGRRQLLKIFIKDRAGTAEIAAFNQGYLKDIFKAGSFFYIYGKFERKLGKLSITAFVYEKCTKQGQEAAHIHLKRITPMYGLTKGITQKWLRNLIYQNLKGTPDEFKGEFKEFLPGKKKDRYYNDICETHFPAGFGSLERGRKRLIYREFLLFQAALAYRKKSVKKEVKGRKYSVKRELLTPFRKNLGFEFTPAQKKVINEIFDDMKSPHPMRRLLQGDVGSGKTVVALAAILLAVENSYQAAVIAPTEILAEQHYLTFKNYLDGLNVKTGILRGGMKKKEKEEVKSALREGDIDIIVGTHALLETDVDLSRTGIIIVDEQHRFGVKQKEKLARKSDKVDLLAMSATPIPRAVAICSYGDMDISTITELPPDRKKPVTSHIPPPQAYKFAKKEIESGHRAYIVHPLVEDSQKNELKSAQKRFKELGATVFKDVSCGLLHGQMGADEKEITMKKFSAGEFQLLFTTTVIEVGIDVAEATVMIIEHFNRYGLATLHQLRGRIARSSYRPYCFLTGKVTTEDSRRRLEVILATSDGFKIAAEDLKIRGPGELFGTKQHGKMEFRIGDPVEDFNLLVKARRDAEEILKKDPGLTAPANRFLRESLFKRY